jgi:hypothetical protein
MLGSFCVGAQLATSQEGLTSMEFLDWMVAWLVGWLVGWLGWVVLGWVGYLLAEI